MLRPSATWLVPGCGTKPRIAELGADQTAVIAVPGRFCTVGDTEKPYQIGKLPLILTCMFLVHGVTLWQYVAVVVFMLRYTVCDGSLTTKQLSVTVRPMSMLPFR